MKRSLSVIAAMAIVGMGSAFGADSLSEALSSGKVSGDLTAYYEGRDKDADSAYAVGQVGLNYETAKFNNFSANFGFRGYTDLWEDNDGNGDWADKRAALKSAYIAYDTDRVHVKAGRQNISTDWLTKDIDGITAYITLFEKAELELIYAKRRGNFSVTDAADFADIGTDGLYKIGLTYALTDAISAKAYYMDVENLHSLYGAKVNYDASANDIGYGGFVHYMKSDQKPGVDDGYGVDLEDEKMIDIQAYIDVNGWYAYAGYTTLDNGFGSAAKFGDTVVQQEEGDYLYGSWGLVDNEVTYLGLYKNVGGVDLTVLYSMFSATNSDKSASGDATELDIWAGYAFSDAFSVAAGFTIVDQDSEAVKTYTGVPDLTQLNATFTYSF